VTNHQNLQVLHGHIQHQGSGHAECFKNAVGCPLIRTGRQTQRNQR
jgi:hypothetical protein